MKSQSMWIVDLLTSHIPSTKLNDGYISFNYPLSYAMGCDQSIYMG